MLRQLAAVAAAVGVLAAPAAGSGGAARWFFTPGPNGASCELDLRRPLTEADCLVGPPQRPAAKAIAVTMSPSGRLTLCRGLRCVGNAPTGTPTIPYGSHVELGPFRCTSLRAGVRCIVTTLGRGFQLGAHGVTRI